MTDLQRYLGAWGHLLILSEDMTDYVHAHPREETQPDPNAGPTGGPGSDLRCAAAQARTLSRVAAVSAQRSVVDGVVYIRGAEAW